MADWGNYQQLSREREREIRGLPIGNITSQVFANIYLNQLDWFVKRDLKVKHYFRYADDFAIIHPDPNYLKAMVGKIQEFLKNELALELHPNKVEIRKLSQGIDFLGYVILPHYIVLRTKTKQRMFRKIKQNKKKLASGLISQETFNQSIQSYLGILKHCQGYGLARKVRTFL